MTKFINPIEPSWKAQAWRLLVGPAHIAYGLIFTLTFGAVSNNLPFEVAKRLSIARIKAKRMRHD